MAKKLQATIPVGDRTFTYSREDHFVQIKRDGKEVSVDDIREEAQALLALADALEKLRTV